MKEFYNKKLKTSGIICLIFINLVLLFTIGSFIFLTITEGFEAATLGFSSVALVFGIFLDFQLIKRCFIKIKVSYEGIILENPFKGQIRFESDNINRVYFEEVENKPICICIETKDGNHDENYPFRFKYQSDYAKVIKEMFGNNGQDRL